MYRHLKSYETSIKNINMFPYQKKALLPVNEDIDTKKLDIALFTYIIQILDDPSKPNYPRIKQLRFKRNELFHMKEDQRIMSEPKFDNQWNEVSQLLTDLMKTFDMTTFNRFKSDNLLLNPDQKTMLERILFEGNIKLLFFTFFFYYINYVSELVYQTSLWCNFYKNIGNFIILLNVFKKSWWKSLSKTLGTNLTKWKVHLMGFKTHK